MANPQYQTNSVDPEFGTREYKSSGKSAILEAVNRIKAGEVPVGRVPDLWDGRSAIRIVEVLAAGV